MKANTNVNVKKTLESTAPAGRRKRILYWLCACGLIAMAAAVAAAWAFKGQNNQLTYQTQPVAIGDLVVTVTATGNLEATNQVEVGSELSGIITSMTADFNDTVQAEQPLAYLDDTKYKAAVLKARAEVASAQANYQGALVSRDAARKTVKRYRKARELTNGKLPSLEVLDQAETDLQRSAASLAVAKASIASAQASLQESEADLGKTVIYAPISGMVLSRNVEVGQTVAASLEAPVLYTLAENLRRMELQVDVDEADVGLVQEGQEATFSVDAYPDRTFTAQITQVRYGAETTEGVVTYKTVLQVDNPELLLRPGMTATARIVVKKIENTLLTPNAALRFTPPNPADDKKQQSDILRSIMPGPPHRRQSAKTENGDRSMEASCVWVLRDEHPVPVTVQKQATDGAVTAVKSTELEEGMPVIVNTIGEKG